LEITNQPLNIHQKESRNGKLLKEFLENTHTTAANTLDGNCDWTRENRNKPTEKSIIDYIIMPNNEIQTIKEMRVDTKGTHRLKGAKETDHNTILATLDLTIQYRTETKSAWKNGGPEEWSKFDNEMLKNIEKENPATYDQMESIIIKNLNNVIGRKTYKMKGPKREPPEGNKRNEG
jgi:hypothetical protein